MLLPRLQLFELEDQHWFPQLWRGYLTDFLKFQSSYLGLHSTIAEFVVGLARKTHSTSVVELCAGSSPLAESIVSHDTSGELEVTITDLYPNISAFEEVSARSKGKIGYSTEPVDARNIPESLRGLRVFSVAFHHFYKENAKQILLDAMEKEEPIAIFEVTRRTPSLMFLVLFAGIPFLLVITPFIKPFSFGRMFWTYVIPVMPIVITWDGLVSCLRTYESEDFEEIFSSDTRFEKYSWEFHPLHTRVRGFLSFLRSRPIHVLVGKKRD